MLVFGGFAQDKWQLWLRPLDSTTTRPLAGTEGGIYPFWSPDSRSLGFFSDGKLKRIDIAGGPVMNRQAHYLKNGCVDRFRRGIPKNKFPKQFSEGCGLPQLIRREYEFGVGTIKGVAKKLAVHRRMVRQAVANTVPPNRALRRIFAHSPVEKPRSILLRFA
jgi:hypothetical protein